MAIDAKFKQGDWKVYVNGGRKSTNLLVSKWAQNAEKLGAGEILLTSMNNDGVKNGFSIELLKDVSKNVGIPVIASGGAGSKADFLKAFKSTSVTGALAASVFHFGEIRIPELKMYLSKEKIPVRWT